MKDKCPYYEANCGNCIKACPKYLAYEKIQEPGIIEQTIEELGVDPTIPTWNLLMAMQSKFAARFHKVDNLTKIEMDHWINAYLVCIEDEVREVREHLNIYPDDLIAKNNMNELEKEFIDIIHFVMDEFISGGASAKDIEKAYMNKYYLEKIISGEIINDFMKFAYNKQEIEVKELYKDYSRDITILLLTSKLLDCSGKVRQCISWKHWKKASDKINFDKLNDAFAETFKTLIDCYCILDMNSDKIREIYVNKNVENCLRQSLGY